MGDANGSVTVVLDGANSYLKGYAWAERVGWIKLGAGAGSGPYANTDPTTWGVNMDGAGNLSGYAWSETSRLGQRQPESRPGDRQPDERGV